MKMKQKDERTGRGSMNDQAAGKFKRHKMDKK